MFDHVKFGVSDYAASKTFFLKALEPLGGDPMRGATRIPSREATSISSTLGRT